MSRNELHLPFGENKAIALTLPPQWEIIGICEPNNVPPCADVEGEIRRALSEPVGSPRLSEMLSGAKKVCVVSDDVSRPTPVHLFFRQVLAEVKSAGIGSEAVTVITALGVHQPMSEDEIRAKIGAWGAARYRVVNHRFDDDGALVRLGRSSRGTEVFVNRAIAEADAVVLLGCIEPHTIAGFGGGYKNLFPGCAGRKTIAQNHRLNTTPATFNMVGSRPEDNPMRCDLEECGRMVAAKVFAVNAVLNGAQKIVKIVAGDPVAAHREGVRVSERIYGVRIPKQCDVLVTSSHPMNLDLRQGFKALANTIKAARPGGLMVNVVAAEEGLRDMNMPKRKIALGNRTVRMIAHMLLPLVGRFSFGMKEEDAYFVYFALQAIKRNDIYFYAPTIPAAFRESLPFLGMHDDLDLVMRKAARAMPGKASVLVFPYGGVTYPILP